MYLVINKCVTAVKVSNFSGHYLRNRSTLDIGVLGYIGIVQHKEHSPEILSIPPGTPCIFNVFRSGRFGRGTEELGPTLDLTVIFWWSVPYAGYFVLLVPQCKTTELCVINACVNSALCGRWTSRPSYLN